MGAAATWRPSPRPARTAGLRAASRAFWGTSATRPPWPAPESLAFPAWAVPSRQEEAVYADALEAALREADPDLVCLAGYMRKVPDGIVRAYAGRLMNVHAALLPAFGGKGMYGLHAHQAVLDYGAKVSGCTVHFVDEGYDTGPIILQTPVPVEEDDTAATLAARVLAAEHETYPHAVALFAQGRLTLEGRRVRINSREAGLPTKRDHS